MRAQHSRRRHAASSLLLWFGMGITTAVLGHSFRDQTIATHIVQSPQSVGFTAATDTAKPEDGVHLVLDTAMPVGFERVYAEVRGERLGFLPGSALSHGLRDALREGVPVGAIVTAADALDPARGLAIRVTVGP